MPSGFFRPRRLVRALGALVALGLAAFVGLSAYFACYLTGRFPSSVGPVPAQLAGWAQPVIFPATDGIRLSGWYLPNRVTAKAVVLLHGHLGNRSQMAARADLLHRAGYSVLLYDARSQGESEGKLISVGWYETADLIGAIGFLRQRGASSIGCIGISQGGATIALAAARLPPEVKWVVMESAYPTMRDALDRRFRNFFLLPAAIAGALFVPIAEWRLRVSVDEIAPIRHVAEFHCPVLILGGATDQNTLVDGTRALFAAASQPKEIWVVPGAGHVDLYGFAQGEYARRLMAFVTQAEAIP